MSHSRRGHVTILNEGGQNECGRYSPHEIATELLPRLSLDEVRADLRYYAEYPEEIGRILAEGKVEAVKARLYRSQGPVGYPRLTSLSGQPRAIREARAGYEEDGEGTDELD